MSLFVIKYDYKIAIELAQGEKAKNKKAKEGSAKMNNKDIRMMLEKTGVKKWELAKACGHRDSWLSVKLRDEIPEDEKLKMISLIQQIAEQKEVEAWEC